jgi:circadian clock protein KaiB
MPAKKTNSTRTRSGGRAGEQWQLRLYIAGVTPRSIAALENLQMICRTHLEGKYEIEVVDLLKNPSLAKGDQIFAVPALVRRLPRPIKKIIGDLSNTERTMVGLNIVPISKGGAP